MGIQDHLTCLLRNLYAGQAATVKTGRGTTDWFQIGKGVHQHCTLSPCLFNLYAEYIMWNYTLDEVKAGIQLGETSITLDTQMTTLLWQKAKRNFRASWMKVKEESEKAGLKLNIQKTKIMSSVPITSRQIDGETIETETDFLFLGSKITADGDCSHEIKRCLLLGRKAMTNLDSLLKSREVTLLTKVWNVPAGSLVLRQNSWPLEERISIWVQSQLDYLAVFVQKSFIKI